MGFLLHPLVGWAVLIVAIVSYLALSLGMGVYQEVPRVHLALAVVGLALLIGGAIRRPAAFRIAGATLAAVLVAGYAWWTLDYSSYGVAEAQEPPKSSSPTYEPGEEKVRSVPRLASLELPNAAGEVVPLLARDESARATLIVLYRGYW